MSYDGDISHQMEQKKKSEEDITYEKDVTGASSRCKKDLKSEKPQNKAMYKEWDSDDEALFDEADVLFDEHADSEDEQWVRDSLLAGSEVTDDSCSVSCPGCFAPLSLQCQPHVDYEGQFRALFVTNCRVVTTETLQKKVKVKHGTLQREQQAECFRPVVCAKCGVEVGVLDTEGVYHFCNVVY